MGIWILSLWRGERGTRTGTGTGTELWRGGGIMAAVGGEEDDVASAEMGWVRAGEAEWDQGVTNPTWRTIGLLGARFGRRGSIGAS